MSAAQIVLLVVVIVAVVLITVVVVARLVMKRVRGAGQAKIAATFQPAEIVVSEPSANFFGYASKGGRQVRGAGALVLTPHRLWFHRFGSSQALEIPLSAITQLDVVRSHAGKSVGRPLVRVTIGDDSAAWFVLDAEGWRNAIAAQLESR